MAVKGGWAFTSQGQVQGYGPSKIQTASAGMPFVLKGVLAIRLTANSEYYIDEDSANKADMPAGVTVTTPGVVSYTFTADTKLEVLRVNEEHDAP